MAPLTPSTLRRIMPTLSAERAQTIARRCGEAFAAAAVCSAFWWAGHHGAAIAAAVVMAGLSVFCSFLERRLYALREEEWKRLRDETESEAP